MTAVTSTIERRLGWTRPLIMAFWVVAVGSVPHPADAGPGGFKPVQKLLDLSGMAWIEDDLFLAVHDAKFPDEPQHIRVSLLKLPASLDGIQWKPLHPRFPGSPSSDLESVSRIPGTPYVLLAESGDDGSAFDRIFLARIKHNNKVDVEQALPWSSFHAVENVEATAVAETANGYLFIWAERAEGESSTDIHWTSLELEPFSIGGGGISSITFNLTPELANLYNRPLVGLDVDSLGGLYGVAAFDPDSDDGPYRSAVLKVGQVSGGAVVLDAQPTVLGVQDGFKTESVVVRENGQIQVFFGTDDENYGGTLRLLPQP